MHLFTDIIHNFNHINYPGHIISAIIVILCLFITGCSGFHSSNIAISDTKDNNNSLFATDIDNSGTVYDINTDEYTTSIDNSDDNLTNDTTSDLSEYLTNVAASSNADNDNYFPEDSATDNSLNDEAAYDNNSSTDDSDSSSNDYDSSADDSDSSSNDYDSPADDSDSSSNDYDSSADDSDSSSNDYDSSTDDSDSEPGNSNPNAWISNLSASANHNQLIIVSANGSRANISMYSKTSDSIWETIVSTNGYVGIEGVGTASEYSCFTPSGIYSLSMAFGVNSNPGTALPYTQVDSSYYWVDDPDSDYYNKFVTTNKISPDWSSAEHIVDYPEAYAYAIAIDYNTACIKGAGSAIFLHCSNNSPTYGCVSVPASTLVTILNNIRPGCAIIIDNSWNIANY